MAPFQNAIKVQKNTNHGPDPAQPLTLNRSAFEPIVFAEDVRYDSAIMPLALGLRFTMKVQVLRGSKQQIAETVAAIPGEIREAVVFVEEPSDPARLIGNLISTRSLLGNNREIMAQGRHGGPGP